MTYDLYLGPGVRSQGQLTYTVWCVVHGLSHSPRHERTDDSTWPRVPSIEKRPSTLGVGHRSDPDVEFVGYVSPMSVD